MTTKLRQALKYSAAVLLVALGCGAGSAALAAADSGLEWLPSVNLLLLDEQGGPIGTGTSAHVYYIHTDHLNTPRVIANQAGQTVWRWENLDPFGANLPNENPSGFGNFTCNLRLPGQYFDQETNLHYNYFRDYDPAIGRYIQSDPIGLRGGINTYAYVGNNPLRRTDSKGLNPSDTPVHGNCRPTACVKGCLDQIMGENVENVVVTTDRTLFPYAITNVNSISVRDTCEGFFQNHFTVLEEYYHVLRQWNTGRLSGPRYLFDNWRDGGYDKNRWEVEAKGFARTNLEAFRKCIACCR